MIALLLLDKTAPIDLLKLCNYFQKLLKSIKKIFFKFFFASLGSNYTVLSHSGQLTSKRKEANFNCSYFLSEKCTKVLCTKFKTPQLKTGQLFWLRCSNICFSLVNSIKSITSFLPGLINGQNSHVLDMTIDLLLLLSTFTTFW